ncbi:MAG: hypothetical protein JJU11_17255 [Candidatus Sumerlaeia bacterium]|nr:hypothetical protein [Candidatus Sumerlaeia bacterium]
MKKVASALALSLCLVGFAQAEWTHVKNIDVSDDIVGAIKSIVVDSQGDILFTTYFGSGDRPIYRVEDPLATSPTLTTFSTTEYASTNGSDLTVDGDGNVYFIHDTNFDTSSYIRKFDSAGNVVASFGSGGTLSPVVFNIAGTPTNRRPRAATAVAGDRFLAFSWGTPMAMAVLDATTGAPVGLAVDTGAATGIADSFQGMDYDPATNTIVGNLRGNLYTIESEIMGASLDNLAEYTIFTKLAGESYPAGNSNNGGSWDADSNLFAFTSSKSTPGTVTIVDLNDPSNKTVLGEGLSGFDPGFLGTSGDVAFFRSGGELYLAVAAESLGDIVIFRLDEASSVSDWMMHD